jgi:hypothetical protein
MERKYLSTPWKEQVSRGSTESRKGRQRGPENIRRVPGIAARIYEAWRRILEQQFRRTEATATSATRSHGSSAAAGAPSKKAPRPSGLPALLGPPSMRTRRGRGILRAQRIRARMGAT